MPTRLEILQELESRGKLPEKFRASFDEARRRGLVGGQQEATAPQTGFVDTAIDVAKSAGTGLRRGAEFLAGTAGDARELGADLTGFLSEKAGASPQTADQIRSAARVLSPFPFAPTTQNITDVTNRIAGPPRQPETTAGEFAQTIGEFAPAALGPGGLGARVARTVLPAVASEAAGQITEGSPTEPFARLGGALAGAVAPGMISRAISPLPIPAARQSLIDTLKKEGVQTTAGQKTGRKLLQFAESELGGGKAGNVIDQQKRQFTAAALKRAGIKADAATPDVLKEGLETIGKEFDQLALSNRLIPDQSMADDISTVLRDYNGLVPASQRAPVLEDIIVDVARDAQGGLSGAKYQALTSRLFKLSKSASNDPHLSSALAGVRNSLDEAMERSIAVNNPADLGKWRDVRKQYRNFLVIERAATGAGEATALGNISPAQLRTAAIGVGGKRSFATGKGDFDELARAGNAVLQAPPQSGTAPRAFVRGAPAAFGGAVGATTTGDALTGAALGIGAPFVAGRGLMSRPVQGFLANQAVGQTSMMDPKTRAALAALLARQSQIQAQP